MQRRKITIIVADDHPITRDGICTALAQANDIEIVGEAKSGAEVLDLVKKLRPQILLLDLMMPGLRPVEIEELIRTKYPETSTLVLTSHDRDVYLTEMIDAGASGYLNKEITAERLIGAIRRAAKDEVLFDEEQYQRANEWRKDIGEKIKQLTSREVEILKLLAKGADNNMAAISLDISPRTVAFHITNILTKLKVNSRQEATIWALKNLSNNLE